MQDNQKYVDRGWQQMSALLDKEMPQTETRRPKAAWWMIAAGIVLVLSGWGYHILSKPATTAYPVASKTLEQSDSINEEDRTDQSDRTQKSPVSELSSAAVPSETSETKSVVGENTSVPGVEGKKYTTGKKVSSNTYVNPTKEKSTKVSDLAIANTKDSGTTDSVIGQKGSANKPLTGIPGKTKNTKFPFYTTVSAEEIILGFEEQYPLVPMVDMADAADENEEGLEQRINVILAELGPMQVQPLDVDASRTLPVIPAAASRERSIGLEGMMAAHMTGDDNPFYGIEVGPGIVLRANKRARIHAGLTYGYYNLDGLGLFSSTSNADAENIGNQGNPDPYTGVQFDLNEVYANNLEISEAQQLTEKFHYLHLPVSVEYRITPRLSASAGVKVAALISAPARFRLNDVRFTPAQLSSASKSFLYDYDILRKFDIAPMLSLGFMITRDLSIEASYTHGLVHYINNSKAADRNDFHRTASMGVRYRIL